MQCMKMCANQGGKGRVKRERNRSSARYDGIDAVVVVVVDVVAVADAECCMMMMIALNIESI